MEPKLFKYIWFHSRREQLAILALVLLSLPFYFMSLDLPKQIINKGIQGDGFTEPGSTQPYFQIGLPFGEALTGAPVTLFQGFALDQSGTLVALSLAFLGLVIVNGTFKFIINTGKGRMGERMLRRMRYELSDLVLRFPILQIRKMKQAEVATMIKDEVEPLGGFIGEAFITPVFLGGQALTAMIFIMLQNVWLGLVAAFIVLVQAFLIPRLRKRILILGKERQLTARQLAGRIAEVIEGAVEIHANDTSNYERADLATRLGRIFYIRYEIFQRKFFVKFLNNFLAQVTPFVFYLAGGLLAIEGRLDIGALVAVIAAYSDLPGPIKELIDWDQRRLDVQIKYEQVIDQFQPSDIIEPWLQEPAEGPIEPLEGEIQLSSVSLEDDAENRLVDSVTFNASITQHIAIVGDASSGKEYLGMMLAGLMQPSGGDISIGGRDLDALPQAVRGHRIGYVGQDVYHFPTTVRENLLYGLKHRPVRPRNREGSEAAKREAEIAESRRAGNATFDFDADWVDYASAGAEGPEDISDRLIEVLSLVDLRENVYRFGLVGSIDPEARPQVAEAILQARTALLAVLEREAASDLVVRFDPEQFNRNASIAENLLFGTPTKDAYHVDALAKNEILGSVLAETGLDDSLLETGLSIAQTMVELFADLPAGHPFFDQFSFIDADDLPDYRTMVARAEKSGVKALAEADRSRLMALPFDYVEARHRLGLVDKAMEEGLVAARKRFAERLAVGDPGAVEPYRPDQYSAAASLQDNILFGRLAYGQAGAEDTVGAAMTEVLNELGLRETVIKVGLDYEVGIGGKRLSSTQRQKLGLARALLKEPDLLIINEATAVMDGATQSRVMQAILDSRQARCVVWTLNRAAGARRFDRILVMRNGRLVEQGSFSDLENEGSELHSLMAAG